MSFIIIILLCHIPYSVYSQAPTDTSYLLTIIIHDNFRNCHPFSYYVSMSRQLQNLKSTKLTEDNSQYKISTKNIIFCNISGTKPILVNIQ